MTFSIIENIIQTKNLDNREWKGVAVVPREKFQTLTEQMFYVLLCLREECCGMDILDRVPVMTQGRVSVGSGTLYNLLEQFSQAGMIRETKVEGRRRSYRITEAGQRRLAEEVRRLRRQAEDYELFGEGEYA